MRQLAAGHVVLESALDLFHKRFATGVEDNNGCGLTGDVDNATSTADAENHRPSPGIVSEERRLAEVMRSVNRDTDRHSSAVISNDVLSSAAKPPRASSNESAERRRAERLRKVLQKAEEEEDCLLKSASEISFRRFARHSESVLDSVMAVLVCANAIFIGLEVDHAVKDRNFQWDVWMIFDIFFALSFWIELMMRLYIKGPREHFSGQERLANLFDLSLIFLDTTQLLIAVFAHEHSVDLDEAGVPAASLFRLVRLARLARVARLLRSNKFKDLLALFQGIMDGMLTLGWSVVVFVLLVYVSALACVEMFGPYPYFRNVSRSMFTVFRCSFGDCSTAAGMPLIEEVTTIYSGFVAFAYCLFVFFVTIGMFNVISAIFVDATMGASAALQVNKQRERLDDRSLWARSVSTLVQRILIASPECQITGRLSESIDALLCLDFERKTIEHLVLDDPVFAQVLKDLDIDPADHRKLGDILDADHSGTIGIIELVNGLQRLRGQPRRSDIVSIDLMVQVLQERSVDILEGITDLKQLFGQQIQICSVAM